MARLVPSGGAAEIYQRSRGPSPAGSVVVLGSVIKEAEK